VTGLLQPRPTRHDPPQRLVGQHAKGTRAQIQIRSLTPHTPVHHDHINALIPPTPSLIPLDPYTHPTERIRVGVRPSSARRVEDEVRHGRDGVLGRRGPAARAEARGVVGQVAGVDAGGGGEGEGGGVVGAVGEAD